MVNKSPLATTVAALSIVAVTSAGAAVGPTSAGDIVGQGAVRGQSAPSVADIGLTVGLNQMARSPQAFRGGHRVLIVQTRRFPNELSLQVPHLEFSLLPARDASPRAN